MNHQGYCLALLINLAPYHQLGQGYSRALQGVKPQLLLAASLSPRRSLC